MSLRFLGDWPPALGFLLALAASTLVWIYYARESKSIAQPYRWLLPTIKSAACLLILLTLLEPAFVYRYRDGDPGKVTFLIDASASMSLEDSSQSSPEIRRRAERAVAWLLHNRQLSLDKLADEFDILVQRFSGDSVETLWQSKSGEHPRLPDQPTQWLPKVFGESTQLGTALSQAVVPLSNNTAHVSDVQTATGKAPPNSKQAIVLLSDGQNNSGPDPRQALSSLADQATIFGIGFGTRQGDAELALANVTYPKRVFRSDVLRGQLTVREGIPVGRQYSAQIQLGDKVVWRQSITAEGGRQRQIEFTVPIERLYEDVRKELPANVRYSLIPVELNASLSLVRDESNRDNNSYPMSLAVSTNRTRVLILDGQPRWETRYLRNMFDRDPQWQVTTLIACEPASFQFPRTREALFEYDLIFLGDLPSTSLTPEQVGWLRSYVETSGGGMVVIAGSQSHLSEPAYARLRDCIPVQLASTPDNNSTDLLPSQAILTSSGAQNVALRLNSNTQEESQQIWDALPPVHFVAPVTALPGSEVLLRANSTIADQPLLVTRRFGAGKVLFMATDETWRWRYKVADLVHRRFWTQLARWVMRVPMAVQSEFISLDTGGVHHDADKSIEIRAQLRADNMQPASGLSPTLVLSRDGAAYAQLVMQEDGNIPGTYVVQTRGLPPGDYRAKVFAAGFSSQATDAAADFQVAAPPSVEMQNTECNEVLLAEMAAQSGGKYVHENDSNQFMDYLRPLSRGRFVESELQVWQTYGWFGSILLLLIADWWLRKRAGLV